MNIADAQQVRVEGIWRILPEEHRRKITKSFARQDPRGFEFWCAKAGCKMAGFRPQAIAARPGSDGERLDAVLFSPTTSCIAKRVLRSFFAVAEARLNERFFELCSHGDQGKDLELPVRALAQLRTELPGEAALLDLYEAALRWLEPSWFRADVPAAAGSSGGGHNGAGQLAGDSMVADEQAVAAGSPQDAAGGVVPRPQPVFLLPAGLSEIGDVAESLLRAHDRGKKALAEFWPRLEARSVVTTNDTKTETAELETVAQQYLKEARAFGGALAAFAPILERELSGELRTHFPLLEKLHGVCGRAQTSAKGLTEAAGSATDCVRQLMHSIEETESRLQEALSDIDQQRRALNLPPPSDSPVLPAPTLHKLVEAAKDVDRQKADLKRVVAARVAEARTALEQELDLFEAEYELPSTQKLPSLTLDELRNSIRLVASLPELEAAKGNVATATEWLGNHTEFLRLESIARQVLSPGLAPKGVVRVAGVLNQRGRQVESMALLLLLQLGWDISDYEEGDYSVFVDRLLESASGINLGPALNLGEAVRCQPWVQQLHARDIEDLATRRCLAFVLTLCHLSGGGGFVEALLSALHAVDLFQNSQFPYCHGLVEACQRAQPVSLSDVIGRKLLAELETQVDKLFSKDERGRYPVGVARGGEFMQMEQRYLIPELERLAADVRAASKRGSFAEARGLLQRVEADKFLERACREAGIRTYGSTFYTKKVLNPQRGGYVAALLGLLGQIVDETARSSQSGEVIIPLKELSQELVGVQQSDPDHSTIWQALRHYINALPQRPTERASSIEDILEDLCNQDAALITSATDLVVTLCREGSIHLDSPAARRYARELVVNLGRQPAGAQRILEKEACYVHAGRLSLTTESRAGASSSWARDLTSRWDRIQADPLNELQTADFSRLIRLGYYPFIEAQLASTERRIREQLSQLSRDRLAWLKLQMDRLGQLKDSVDEIVVAEEWREAIFNRAHRLERRLRQLKNPSILHEELAFDQGLVEQALDTLMFLVEHRAHAYEEVDALLTRIAPEPDHRPIPETSSTESSLAGFPDLRNAWFGSRGKKDSATPELVNTWETLACEFARLGDLYHELHTTLVRTPIQRYPFPAYATRFHAPKSTFLSRPVLLYLVPGGSIEADRLRVLEEQLNREQSVDSFHILLVPDEATRIQTHLTQNVAPGVHVVVIDESGLARMSAHERHDVPLRQMLHRAVLDLTLSSPFKSDGYVHQLNNIFVGRKAALTKMQTQSCTVIWGGRRTGKTSLMHALRNSLQRQKWSVAYVDAASHALGEDPDLSVAKAIAAELSLEAPSDLGAFNRSVHKKRADVRVAVLLDEMDGYIGKSSSRHETEFPLARCLRGLAQSDSAQRFKVVYSGFRKLYYECRMRYVQDTSYPFRQFLEQVECKDLTFEEVESLVRIGFEDTLDVELDPSVPRRVFERASGHPAFVQRFCERLLCRINQRRQGGRRLLLGVDDVEAVYREDQNNPGDEAFIYYVDETLGWNLSHLGRATLLAMSEDIISGNAGQSTYFPVEHICRSLTDWCGIADLPAPDSLEIQNTLELLKMTNMVLAHTEQGRRSYRISYPTYTETLTRLDRAGMSEITKCLREYDSQERGRSVM